MTEVQLKCSYSDESFILTARKTRSVVYISCNTGRSLQISKSLKKDALSKEAFNYYTIMKQDASNQDESYMVIKAHLSETLIGLLSDTIYNSAIFELVEEFLLKLVFGNLPKNITGRPISIVCCDTFVTCENTMVRRSLPRGSAQIACTDFNILWDQLLNL
jgi:hypothetical protein